MRISKTVDQMVVGISCNESVILY